MKHSNGFKSRAAELGVSQEKYRKAYMRWKAAIRRGHKLKLSAFLRKGYVRAAKFKGKPKAYFYARRTIEQAFATPRWVDVEAICQIYAKRPTGYHVDHIIPIKGENVCGLHVPWNLQYLPAKVNVAKGNKT